MTDSGWDTHYACSIHRTFKPNLSLYWKGKYLRCILSLSTSRYLFQGPLVQCWKYQAPCRFALRKGLGMASNRKVEEGGDVAAASVFYPRHRAGSSWMQFWQKSCNGERKVQVLEWAGLCFLWDLVWGNTSLAVGRLQNHAVAPQAFGPLAVSLAAQHLQFWGGTLHC